MIHQVKLSPLIQQRLMDIVKLQQALLLYASVQATLDQPGCALHLDQKYHWGERSSKIAKWVWNSKARHEPLEQFAAGPQPDKLVWAQQLGNEAISFESNPGFPLTPFVDRTAPDWKKAGPSSCKTFTKICVVRDSRRVVFDPWNAILPSPGFSIRVLQRKPRLGGLCRMR